MASFAHARGKFDKALYELCEVDYDAVEAYEAAIVRLESQDYKNRLSEFKSDHERHIQELSNLLKRHNIRAPEGPCSSRQLLVQGRVIFANLFGDEAILRAMLANEIDTNIGYELLNDHEEKWEDSGKILRLGVGDERRHKQWFEITLGSTK
ncbi:MULTISPECIES: ferritin-like domain-containing protein [unclassified Legionella]|uniref:ferritin-like domain-containing protein n=1 Tax=unclassified Legionella TaxID=2622702 RepID=UPI0010541889|nr:MULTISPECIES: ferritin-like domain-containing protein [unclassified Legionella]MDI9818296.1 ferritin-like domain-containing protein [Legionella sp. PL877]